MVMGERDETYWKVWGYLVRLVQEEAENTSEGDVARRIGVARTTVNRWIRGLRGERVELGVCLRIIETLGGDLVELARELGYEDMARILELGKDKQRLLVQMLELLEKEGTESEKKKEEQQLLLDILQLLKEGGPAAKKLRQEIEFLKQMK